VYSQNFIVGPPDHWRRSSIRHHATTSDDINEFMFDVMTQRVGREYVIRRN